MNYVKNKQIILSNKDLKKMSQSTIKNAVKIYTNEIKKDGIKFPYTRLYISKKDILKKFNNLKRFQFKLDKIKYYEVYNLINKTNDFPLKYKGHYTILVTCEENFTKYNIITDYFQEECRFKCKRFDENRTVMDCWYEDTEKILWHCINKYKKIDAHGLHESIYDICPRGCTTFRITTALSFYKMFNAKVILDFSAGWGDRLIAAMAHNVDYYCGVDPNTSLHPNYQRMINTFTKYPQKYELICDKFQSANIPKKKYNLIFTSPPYYNLEHYSDESTQSDVEFDTLDSWLKGFLFASIAKAWNLLMFDGYMILSMNDFLKKTGINFVEKTNIYIESLPHSKYIGAISYAQKTSKNTYKSPQPIWIWKKISNMN